jgi:hypothetical protein
LLTFKDTVTNYDEVGIKKLSDYGFFKQPLHQLIPATKQVIPYEINSPLFTDYASKKRFISFPEGSSASYKNDETVLDFPSGTIIIKNFYYKNADLKTTTSDIIIETLNTPSWFIPGSNGYNNVMELPSDSLTFKSFAFQSAALAASVVAIWSS